MTPSDPELPPAGGGEPAPAPMPAPFSEASAGIPQPSADLGPPVDSPPAKPPREPFWSFSDLLFFLALCLPCLLLALAGVKLFGMLTPLSNPFEQLLLAQLIWYVLVFTSLYGLFHWRYRRPFWRSLGWNPLTISAIVVSLLLGPLLAAALGIFGFVLRTPEIELPFQQLITDRTTLILTGVFVVVLGPVCEELAFRGFMMPLFIRIWGAAAGILVTGALFGLAHGAEYEWSWRHILLITVAGSIFGWARYKTGSTAAAAFMHSTFNLTQFAAFLAQSRTL